LALPQRSDVHLVLSGNINRRAASMPREDLLDEDEKNHLNRELIMLSLMNPRLSIRKRFECGIITGTNYSRKHGNFLFLRVFEIGKFLHFCQNCGNYPFKRNRTPVYPYSERPQIEWQNSSNHILDSKFSFFLTPKYIQLFLLPNFLFK